MRSLLSLALALSILPAAHAQDKPTPPDTLAKSIAPFVDDMTAFVAHADLSRLDVAQLFKFVDDLGIKDGDIDEARDFALQMVKVFRAAGGRDILVLYNWDAPNPTEDFLIVIPVPDKTPFKAVVGFFSLLPNLKTRVQDGALLISTARNLERMKTFKATPRPELADALAAFEEDAAKVIFLPPPILVRAFAEMFPRIADNLGGGSSREMGQALRWLGAGLKTGDKLQAALALKTSGADAAKKYQQLIKKALELPLEGELQMAFPDLPKLRDRLTPEVKGERLVLAIDEEIVKAALGPAVKQSSAAAARTQSTNNLKQIGLAFHAYHDVNKSLPPAFTRDAKGKALLSWRVHVLPYLDAADLYNEFRLDEPWDSAHNKKLIDKMPEVLRSPLSPELPRGKTTYLVPTGPMTIFASPKGIHFAKVRDGTSNTILVLEANPSKAVFWTQPEDFPIDQKDLLAGLLQKDAKGFPAAFADGSVRFLAAGIRPAILRALLTASGGESINIDEPDKD